MGERRCRVSMSRFREAFSPSAVTVSGCMCMFLDVLTIKPKTSSTSNEAGEGTTTTGASKKRKPPPQSSEAAGASASAAGTAGVGGAKKHPKLSEQQQQQQQQTANADHSAGAGTMTGEINGSSQQVLREVGSSAAVVNGAVRGSSSAAAGTATSGAKVMTAGASGALSGANGSSVVIGRESDGTSPRQVGTGGAVTPGNSEARGNDASATDAGASGTAGAGGTAAAGGSVENSGKTGPGEKGGKNGVKPSSPTWDTKLETAMVKFEEGKKCDYTPVCRGCILLSKAKFFFVLRMAGGHYAPRRNKVVVHLLILYTID